MPTFKRVEIVDARQFTGGVQNGTDLVYWVQSNEGSLMWVDELKGSSPRVEHIRLFHGPGSHKAELAFIGDWIMQRQSGDFEVVRPQTLASEFEQV